MSRMTFKLIAENMTSFNTQLHDLGDWAVGFADRVQLFSHLQAEKVFGSASVTLVAYQKDPTSGRIDPVPLQPVLYHIPTNFQIVLYNHGMSYQECYRHLSSVRSSLEFNVRLLESLKAERDELWDAVNHITR